MAQLNFYVPDDIEQSIRQQAKERGKSISSYLAEVVKGHVQHDRWRSDFFTKVAGGWQGDFQQIERPLPEERNDL